MKVYPSLQGMYLRGVACAIRNTLAIVFARCICRQQIIEAIIGSKEETRCLRLHHAAAMLEGQPGLRSYELFPKTCPHRNSSLDCESDNWSFPVGNEIHASVSGFHEQGKDGDAPIVSIYNAVEVIGMGVVGHGYEPIRLSGDRHICSQSV